MFVASKHEMSGILWNVFSQSLRPIGAILGGNGRSKFRKNFFDVEKWNVGDHLKRVFPKFEAERSHLREVIWRPFKVYTLEERTPLISNIKYKYEYEYGA